jgi:hypothetical protein
MVNEFIQEMSKRQRNEDVDPRTWALSYGGRPIEFLCEIAPKWSGPDWAAWRAFVKTLFAVDLDDNEHAIYRLCTGLEWKKRDRPFREAWMPVGRRGGKSYTLALIAVYMACCHDWTPYLADGQFGYVSVLSDSRKHSVEIMNYVKGLLRHPRLALLVKRPLAETIELEGQTAIEIVTASIKAVRAQTRVASFCDEIAFWEVDEDSANPDVEILQGLRPAMITIPGSLLLGASSRYARRGVLWDAYRDYYGKPTGPLVWAADTLTMHPSISQEILDEERARDPVSFAAEYGVEWRSDVAEFIPRERVEALVVPGRYELPYVPGLRYFGFADPAGGSGEDSMTLAIAHHDPKTGMGVLDALRERRPQPSFDPEDEVENQVTLLKSYRLTEVAGDRYAANWCSGQYRKRGIAYVESEMTASDLYREALPLLNGARVELLDDKRFIHQVCQLERTTSRLGKDTISHPLRQHDDLANVGLAALVHVMAKPSEVERWIKAFT